jgi:hypothetical protein
VGGNRAGVHLPGFLKVDQPTRHQLTKQRQGFPQGYPAAGIVPFIGYRVRSLVFLPCLFDADGRPRA